MDGIELEYWDSCTFLALLKNETHRNGEQEYLQSQARKFDMGALGLVTSAIAVAEIFESRLNKEQADRFRSMYTRSNFQFIDANFQICSVASEIRGYYKNNPIKDGGKELYPSAPDAIHVASAIAAQSFSKLPILLITFDSDNKPEKKEIGLTKISGSVAGKYQLTICRPPSKQLPQPPTAPQLALDLASTQAAVNASTTPEDGVDAPPIASDSAPAPAMEVPLPEKTRDQPIEPGKSDAPAAPTPGLNQATALAAEKKDE
jgi:hypothetical protein